MSAEDGRTIAGPRGEPVSVVLPVRDGAQTLPQLLAALAQQRTSFPVEIVAVDSGSRDASVALLEAAGARVERIAPQDFDHGRTRNLAIAAASAERIVLLTQDAVPIGPDFLEAIVAPLDEPGVAAVYGRQVPRPDCDVVTRRQLEGWLTGRTAPARARLAGDRLDALEPSERHALCTFDNVCSALRRDVWKAHPFPATPFGEDLAFGRAVIEAGLTIAYAPAAAVLHSHRRSVLYEYRRTRQCHRTLHELFGVATLPRRRDVARAVAGNWRRDLPFVWRRAPAGPERLRQLARIAALAVLAPLAQHHGIRDARRLPRREGGR